MKTTILTTLTVLMLAVTSIQAQTNNSVAPITTNTVAVDYNKIDLTLSGVGTSYHGQSELGFDVSFSIDPIKKLPNLWVGASQSLYWQPSLAASTDIDADWNTHIYKNLYIQTGWSAGSMYGSGSPAYRTGPEFIAQYYMTDNVYTYAGVNYDAFTSKETDNNNSSGSGWRWSIGIGWEF